MFFTTQEVESWINEDAPMVDLTSQLLGIGTQAAMLTVRARHPVCVALTEEAARMFTLLDAEILGLVPTGTRVQAGDVLLAVRGPAAALHRGWKVAMNLLEHMCGVATRTAEIVDKVRAVSSIAVLATRKHLPGMKKPLIKAILAGGAQPHRLGLSETVLIFENHLRLVGGREQLPGLLQAMKAAACEKKILVECETREQALQALAAGADGVQFDKVPVASLGEWCRAIAISHPGAVCLAAGGIRLENVQEFARSGVHGIVLSSLYHAAPADLEVRIHPA